MSTSDEIRNPRRVGQVHLRAGGVDENRAIGRRLEQVRGEKGLNQESFAESLRVSLRTYQNYERGERPISKDFLSALIEKHDVDPRWLLTGSKAPPAPINLVAFKEIAHALRSDYSDWRDDKLPPHVFAYQVARVYNNNAGIDDQDQRRQKVLRELINDRYSTALNSHRFLSTSPEFLKHPGAAEQLKKLEDRAQAMQSILQGESEFRSAMKKVWDSFESPGEPGNEAAESGSSVNAGTVVNQTISGDRHHVAGRDIVHKTAKRKK